MEMVQWVVSGVRQQRWTAVSGQVTDTVCAQVSSFFKTEDDNDAASGGDTLLKGFLGRKKELPHVQPSEQCITHGRQHMNISYHHYAKRYFKKVHEAHDFQMSVFTVTRILCPWNQKKKKIFKESQTFQIRFKKQHIFLKDFSESQTSNPHLTGSP